jgi:serine/threonine protein kinase
MLSRNHFLQQRYRIIRALSAGGFGQVYEALDDKLDCIVAIKERLARLNSEKMRRAFEKEAKLLANLRHPVLPKVMDHFFVGDGQYLVMEFIEGDDLARLLSKWKQPFTVEQVLTWADELLKALTYLHTRPEVILHRDIKPANIKLTNDGEIFLLDFGLAKGYAGEMSVPDTSQRSSSVHGFTAAYAPLEQLNRAGTNEQSDIYSFGASLYHLLTGRPPVSASRRYDSIEMGGRDPLLAAHELNQFVPQSVSSIISQAMAMSRRERLGSATEMRQALIDARREMAESETETYSPSFARTSQQPARPPSNTPVPLISSPSVPSPDASAQGLDQPPVPESPHGDEDSWPSQFTSETGDPSWASTIVDSELQDEDEPAPLSKEAQQEAVEAIERKEREEELERERLAESARKAAEEKRLREEAEERERVLAEQERLQAEEARRQREAKAARRADEERRRQEYEERERLKAAEEAGIKAKEEIRRREVEAQRQAEAARRLEEEEKRKKAQEEAQRHEEEERQRAEAEARREAAEAAKRKAAEEEHPRAAPEPADELSTIAAETEIYRPSPVSQSPSAPRFNYKLMIGASVCVVLLLFGAVVLAFLYFKDSVPSQTAQANQATDRNQPAGSAPAATSFSLKQSIGNQGGTVWAAAFSSDGKLAASAGDNKTVRVWETASWQLKSELKGHSDIINSVAFSPDGRFIASGSKDKNILIWNIADGSPPRTLSNHVDQVLFVAFSADGQTLASASADRTIKLWNIETGNVIATLEGHTDEVWSIAFSPDVKTLISAGRDNTIRIWDVVRRIEKGRLAAAKVYSIALSSDGETLASGQDNKVKLWNLRTGKGLRVLSGHTEYISFLAFTQDGATLASASNDGQIKLWDVQSGQLKQTLAKDKKGVETLSFSPDGKTLLSGGRDQDLKIWQ